jgi:hypothetical protein
MGSELAVHKQTAENLGRRGRWGSQWLTPQKGDRQPMARHRLTPEKRSINGARACVGTSECCEHVVELWRLVNANTAGKTPKTNGR